MKKWKESKIKELIQNKNGYTWSKEQELQKYEEKSIRVLTVSNIQKELDLSVELYLQNVSEEDKIEKKVSKNWIIAVSSNGNRNRIGNPVFIKENMDFLFASFLTAFKPKNENELSPEFFFYWMSTNSVQQKITAVSEGTTGLGNMNLRHFKNMKISYPELEEQNAIAGIISKVDQCIENAQKTIDATQKLKKSLMQNLLTGRMKPDGTIRKENEFYEHPKIGKVPIGWEVKKIKELFYVRAGGDLKEQYFSSEKTEIYKYPIYSNTLVDKGLYGFTSLPLFPKDTITIAGRGVGIGHVEYRDTEYDAIVRLNVLILKENLDYFVKYFSYLISHTVHFVNESTGVPQLTAPAIRINYIAFPKDKKIQEYISNQFDLIDKKILYKKQKIIFLQRLKKSLMQTLLTGKKRVDVTKINSLLKTMK